MAPKPRRNGTKKGSAAIDGSFHAGNAVFNFLFIEMRRANPDLLEFFFLGKEIAQRRPPRRFPQRNSELRSSMETLPSQAIMDEFVRR